MRRQDNGAGAGFFFLIGLHHRVGIFQEIVFVPQGSSAGEDGDDQQRGAGVQKKFGPSAALVFSFWIGCYGDDAHLIADLERL